MKVPDLERPQPHVATGSPFPALPNTHHRVGNANTFKSTGRYKGSGARQNQPSACQMCWSASRTTHWDAPNMLITKQMAKNMETGKCYSHTSETLAKVYEWILEEYMTSYCVIAKLHSIGITAPGNCEWPHVKCFSSRLKSPSREYHWASLWNIYFNVISQLISQAYAYNCTLSFICDTSPHYQTMIIARHHAPNIQRPALLMDSKTLTYNDAINDLEVQIDSHLTIMTVLGKKPKTLQENWHRPLPSWTAPAATPCTTPRFAPWWSTVRWYGHAIPHLSWTCPSPSSTPLTNANDRQIDFQSLCHRPEVAGLCVLYKTHKQNVSLRLQPGATTL